MLTFREELSLTALREMNLACVIGLSLSFVLFLAFLVAALGPSSVLVDVAAAVEGFVFVLFLSLQRRLMGRIRFLEQFT